MVSRWRVARRTKDDAFDGHALEPKAATDTAHVKNITLKCGRLEPYFIPRMNELPTFRSLQSADGAKTAPSEREI